MTFIKKGKISRKSETEGSFLISFTPTLLDVFTSSIYSCITCVITNMFKLRTNGKNRAKRNSKMTD